MRYFITVSAIVIGMLFSSSVLGLAGEKFRWYIIRGKDKVCRVIEADKRTPATIAGPYKTRENALAAKAEHCGDKRKTSKKKASTRKKGPLESEIDRAVSRTRKELNKQMK